MDQQRSWLFVYFSKVLETMMPSSLQDSIYLMEEEPVVFICLV